MQWLELLIGFDSETDADAKSYMLDMEAFLNCLAFESIVSPKTKLKLGRIQMHFKLLRFAYIL